jgi:Cu(I)/Ag(I) efflux system membrane fusion protein
MPEVTARAQRLVDSSRLRLRHLGLSDEMIDDVATWSGPDHRLLLGGAGEFWIYASVYEYELPLVHPQQMVTIDVSSLAGQTFDGTVKAIDPMLDPATRTARVRILVKDPDGVLKPEMFVNASIAVEAGEVLAVPEEAVFDTGTKRVVFVDKGEGLFEPRDVTVGVKAEGYYEIKSGVAEGELVVTSGNFLIDSESRLKAALEGMTGGGHQHGGQPR